LHAPTWPHSPSLNCTTGCLAWAPVNYLQHASGEGLAFEQDVLRFLVGKWLVLIGDSAARMMYHQLASLLSGKWTVWSGVGDMNNHFAAGSCFDRKCAWTDVSCPCLDEAFVGGVRLTMISSKFGVQADMRELAQLAKTTVGVPSAVLVCIGTWWAMKDTWKAVGWSGTHAEQYGRALRGVADAVVAAFSYQRSRVLNGTVVDDTNYLREAWAVPPRYVIMGLPMCGSAPVPAHTRARSQSLNHAARRLVSTELNQSWEFFNREALTARVCTADRADCNFGYPHPVGRTQNRELQVLMQGLRAAVPERGGFKRGTWAGGGNLTVAERPAERPAL